MMPNYYDRERLAQAHRQDLLREAEHERLLAHLPQPNHHVLLLSSARLTLFVRSLLMRLRSGGQHREQPV
jgi:hypothetical protein